MTTGDPDSANLRIGDLSARTGATARMLRYYEEQGLLTPRRTPAGYRLYTPDDVKRVARIRCMLAAALPTTVVRHALEFLSGTSTAASEKPGERTHLAASLRHEMTALDERIQALTHSRDLLAVILTDIRNETVGPGRPGDTSATPPQTAVRRTGPREPHRTTAD
ncbi:MerR family transcriptional regulator [Mangrovihabitans endophyticus]|uniref:MerR family transcriptional regulator n=1 Tax=Mangrovihabitans endophyticus TaxID=1751298 RepID=A0A8J3FQH9_9ACTN|nr:MerR family transcriptional regulator [Mangrovihabitans endophyticus]GGL09595.1 MerR family transcriptional regulator [Mangrovihabitans endophyticus]